MLNAAVSRTSRLSPSQVASPTPSTRRIVQWLAGLLVLAAFQVCLANDGRHHWHEFRDLYSGLNYSTADLMRGQFDPGPSPLGTPAQVATWYANKLLHVY